MVKFGFKEIDFANWLQPDPIYGNFVRLSETGEAVRMVGEDWINPLLKPKLLEAVPHDIQAMFEVARGAMIYGYFFYPLWTLGTEQLYRVTEAAVSHKCTALGSPKSKKNFKDKIDWLENEKVISPIDTETLHNIRELRNLASHPSSQSIITPGMGIQLLEWITLVVNSIFSTEQRTI